MTSACTGLVATSFHLSSVNECNLRRCVDFQLSWIILEWRKVYFFTYHEIIHVHCSNYSWCDFHKNSSYIGVLFSWNSLSLSQLIDGIHHCKFIYDTNEQNVKCITFQSAWKNEINLDCTLPNKITVSWPISFIWWNLFISRLIDMIIIWTRPNGTAICILYSYFVLLIIQIICEIINEISWCFNSIRRASRDQVQNNFRNQRNEFTCYVKCCWT